MLEEERPEKGRGFPLQIKAPFAPVYLRGPVASESPGGPQKPSSWLSEGVRGIFTINTEVGEKSCVPHLHILGVYDHGGIGPSPRTGPQVGVADERSAGISSGGSGFEK